MAKYDFKFKLKVVKSYLKGKDGYSLVAKRYGIPNHAQVQRWVNTYNTLGKNGLKLKTKDTYYTVQFNGRYPCWGKSKVTKSQVRKLGRKKNVDSMNEK